MGTVVISADAELGWGFHDQKDPPADRLANARQGWQALIALCDEYRLDTTWAVVGHLLLDECDGRHDEHPMPRTWFAHEQGDDAMPPELRYGDGLIDDLQDAEASHDIGLHTFSHVEFGESATTRQIARAEVAAGLELARERGIEMQSFVFPRNNIGHLDVLAAYGIECYRGINPASSARLSWDDPLGKLAWGTVARKTPPLIEPTLDSVGLVNIPASLHLFSFEGLPRTVVEPILGDPIVRQAKLGIDAATERDGVFHIWLHPNSITEQRDVERLRTIFAYLDRQRARTSLAVKTMADIASEILAETEEPPTTAVERS